MNNEVNQMFETAEGVEQSIAKIAEQIVLEDDALSQLQAQVDERKEKLLAAKQTLADMMIQSGMQSVKLDNGLTPSVQMTKKYFKASGVEDEQLFDWLKQSELGHIIKPTVHYGTLQTTMRSYEENGGIVPETIFNVINERSVRMNGKSKFLANNGNLSD